MKRKNFTCSNIFFLGQIFFSIMASISFGVSLSLQDASSILWTLTQCVCLRGRDMHQNAPLLRSVFSLFGCHSGTTCGKTLKIFYEHGYCYHLSCQKSSKSVTQPGKRKRYHVFSAILFIMLLCLLWTSPCIPSFHLQTGWEKSPST